MLGLLLQPISWRAYVTSFFQVLIGSDPYPIPRWCLRALKEISCLFCHLQPRPNVPILLPRHEAPLIVIVIFCLPLIVIRNNIFVLIVFRNTGLCANHRRAAAYPRSRTSYNRDATGYHQSDIQNICHHHSASSSTHSS